VKLKKARFKKEIEINVEKAMHKKDDERVRLTAKHPNQSTHRF
jgi:hypothetical protein